MSFFNTSTQKETSDPLQERSDNFFNKSNKKSFFNNSEGEKLSFFNGSANKQNENKNGQKNSFFGGNSSNKKAQTWFANTSINPIGGDNQRKNSQSQRQVSQGSIENKIDLNMISHTPSQKKSYNPSEWSLNDFEIGMPIGRGGFGKVYLARTKKEQFICAIKVVNKARLSTSYSHLIAREIEIQKQLNHKNILKLFAYFWDDKNIYMVTEYAPDGDLFHKLQSQIGKKYDEPKAAYFIKQISKAFQYLHSLNILHRDLKPENILVSDDDLKLCDFGWAAYVGNQERQTYCGTTDYLSPELINEEKYGKEVDIWSIGILTFELCTGKAPFQGKSDKNTRKNIMSNEFKIPDRFSPELKDFIIGILKLDPNKRPKIDQLLQHRWIIQNNNYFSPNVSGYHGKQHGTKSKLRLKSSREKIGLKMSRNSSYNGEQYGKMSPDSSSKYFTNKENSMNRPNAGYFSPDVRSKKNTSVYLQNFQKLMGNRSGGRNVLQQKLVSGRKNTSPGGKRLQSMKNFRKNNIEKNLESYTKNIDRDLNGSPRNNLMDKMNSSYGYGHKINGSLNLNSSNSSYSKRSPQRYGANSPLGRVYDQQMSPNRSNKLEYAQQITQIAQMRQLGKFDNPSSGSHAKSPSLGQYMQLRMNKSKNKISSPGRNKYKSPKRKSPSSKNFIKKSSSTKKFNKSPSRDSKRNKSGMRKGSLGMIQRYQNKYTSGSQNNSLHGTGTSKLRNRSYNHGGNYPMMEKINKKSSPIRNQIGKFTLDSSETQHLMHQVQAQQGRNTSSPKLSKQKMKLRNVLNQRKGSQNSPSRDQAENIKNILKSKWSRSHGRKVMSPTLNKTVNNSSKRTPRLSKKALSRNRSAKESPIRIGGNGAELLGAIYKKQSSKYLDKFGRKQSTGSNMGLNLVRNTQQSKQQSNQQSVSRNSNYSKEGQEFSSGLKLYNRNKQSAWNSKKRLNSSNYSRTSANESVNSSTGQQLTNLRQASQKCVDKIVDINNYKKQINETRITDNYANPENLIQANTHHFNTNIRHQNNPRTQAYNQDNSQNLSHTLARKLSPFNLTQRRGSMNTTQVTTKHYSNVTQRGQTPESRYLSRDVSQKTSQRNSSNFVTSPTIKISSKRQIMLNHSQNSHNSAKLSITSEMALKTTTSQEKYSKFYKLKNDEYTKFRDLTFVERCGYQLYSINKGLKVNKDVYDMIRIYADHAQEIEFNKIEKIFHDREASNLFARIMKLERWAITLVFYFQVEPYNNSEADNMLTVMKNLVEEIWKNHNNLVNWIKILNKEFQLKWILNDLNRIYWDVNLDKTRLTIHIKSCVRVITGLLQQMNSYLSQEHQAFQEIFFENLDNWSVIKCFEKGFECFYQSLAQKGVISVNKKQSKQSTSPNKSISRQQVQKSKNPLMSDSKNKKQVVPSLPISGIKPHKYMSNLPSTNDEDAKILTPKKKYNTSVIEEVDEELQKTERKSIGDKSQESDKSKKKKKNSDTATTPNLNNTKHPRSSTKKRNPEQKMEAKKSSKGPNTSEKKRINRHLEEEEKDALEIMKAARKIENVPFFLFQPDTNQMNVNRALLPLLNKDRRYTLVLDLDETLVHFQEQENGKNQFLIRPYAQFFLKEMSKWYELVIFTAGLKDYADYILDRLDTQNWITHRLYRRHCDPQGNVYQKDLSKLGRDLSKTLIVDNSAENFQLQPDNGIYIKSWYDDPDDKALPQLAPLLIDIVKKGYADVRVAMKKLGEKMMEQYNANPTKPIFELSLEPQDNKSNRI